MDDLVERVATAVYRTFEDRPEYARTQMNGHIADAIAKAIIPIVYEDAAKVIEQMPSCGWTNDTLAKAIRSRSMTIVGE